MNQSELIPHLFRTEFRKIASVLCKTFGIGHIEIAEDIAGETFLSALESWSYKGVPENPVAWLYTVAKNKARNYLHRDAVFREKIVNRLSDPLPAAQEIDIDLSDQNITDSQLQMLFAICHPAISTEAQIGLSLRILCGFGIDEIANAFLTTKETISKRLYRAKEKLRAENIRIEMPCQTEISLRLDTILRTLYLLFSEGYYSESQDAVLRKDLCLEAMRLTYLLTENRETNLPEVNALLSLMCFHASRFEARKDASGALVLYDDQDETLWNEALIKKGIYFLHEAAQGEAMSAYHLEATIAYWHTIRTDANEKWENILHLYDMLLQLEYSPVAALNRAYALSKVQGNITAITEAEKLMLNNNHFYFTLLGTLYTGVDKEKARHNYETALTLAKTATDKLTIRRKIDMLQDRIS